MLRNARYLVNKGYGDIKVTVNGEEIESIKSILCGFNDILSSIVLKAKFDGYLELVEGCTEKGFYALECYYGGGDLVISRENCLDILIICNYYKELDLLKECEDFVIESKDEDIIKSVLAEKNIIRSSDLNNLREFLVGYLINENNDLILESLENFALDDIEKILSDGKVTLEHEVDYVKKIIDYYDNEPRREEEKEDFRKRIINIILKLDLSRFTVFDLNAHEHDVIKSFREVITIMSKIKQNKEKMETDLGCSDKTKEIILKYYTKKEMDLVIDCINLLYI